MFHREAVHPLLINPCTCSPHSEPQITFLPRKKFLLSKLELRLIATRPQSNPWTEAYTSFGATVNQVRKVMMSSDCATRAPVGCAAMYRVSCFVSTSGQTTQEGEQGDKEMHGHIQLFRLSWALVCHFTTDGQPPSPPPPWDS